MGAYDGWTLEQLTIERDKLNRKLNSGARLVRHGSKEVQLQAREELVAQRAEILRAIGALEQTARPRARRVRMLTRSGW